MAGCAVSDLYSIEVSRAWLAYNRKFPFVPFYQFAAAFKAGWDATTAYERQP